MLDGTMYMLLCTGRSNGGAAVPGGGTLRHATLSLTHGTRTRSRTRHLGYSRTGAQQVSSPRMAAADRSRRMVSKISSAAAS